MTTPFEKAKGDFDKFKGAVHTYEGTAGCQYIVSQQNGQAVLCGQVLDWKKEYAQPANELSGPYHIIAICRASGDHTIERYGYWSQDPSVAETGMPPGAMDRGL